MKFEITHKILFGLIAAVFILLSPIAAFAESVTYTYDATNRLIQVNETGTVIEYEYDNVGNLQQRIRLDSVTSDPSSKYFGFVNIGSTSPSQSFTITNSVTYSIVIGSVVVGGTNSTSFVKTGDTCSGQTLQPAGTCTIQAAFSPLVMDINSATISIILSSPAGASHDIPLIGRGGIPVIVASPLSLNFGSVTVSSTSPSQTVMISDSGSGSLVLGTLTLTGTNASEFQIVPPDGCSARTIAPSANCSVQVVFQPFTGGAKSAALAIPSNDPSTPTKTVTLNGTGSFSISGSVTYGGGPLSGVTMTLSGSGSATTTTDTSGNYTLTGLASGSYTVTPSKTGYTFSPINRAVTISGASVTGQNFTGAGAFSISGSVKNSHNRAIAGVTMILSGTAAATTTTDSSGNYTFTGLAAGSFTVTPSNAGYIFTPVNRTVIINNSNVTNQNFTGTNVYSISGTVTSGGYALSGVTMTLSGDAAATTTTDSSGNYTFTGVAAGNYTVTPSKSGYSFMPVNRAVTVSSSNVTGQNFGGTPGYTISGTVKTSNNKAVSGATMTLSGAAAATTTTDSSGNYIFNGLMNGSYTVTPTLPGYTFTPTSRAVTINNANVTGQNFTRN